MLSFVLEIKSSNVAVSKYMPQLRRLATQTQGKYLFSMIWSENANSEIYRLFKLNSNAVKG